MQAGRYRRCSTCGTTKPLDAFHRDQRATDGHRRTCKPCATDVVAAWRRVHPERRFRSFRTRRCSRYFSALRARQRRESSRPLRRFSSGEGVVKDAVAIRRFPITRELRLALKVFRAPVPLIGRNALAARAGQTPHWRQATCSTEAPASVTASTANGMAYTARQLGAYVAPVHRAEILERDLGLCGICGDPVDPANYHVDHVIPMTKGGTHEPDNVQVAHPFCNLSKGATVPDR